ncbi:DUF2796 domain-containing protein [Candidatus Actinomarina]|nr:DUF2796 domain-containing protein [Candidatus Actinomarina sp.]
MKKYFICCFIFLISCSSAQNEDVIIVEDSSSVTVTTTVPELTFENDHDEEEGHVDHDHDDEVHIDHKEEGHEEQDHSDLISFMINVKNGIPEKLEVIEATLGTKGLITIISEVSTELHFHGYDLYLDIVPGESNEIIIDFMIAGEFEVEDHNSGYEVARLKVSP